MSNILTDKDVVELDREHDGLLVWEFIMLVEQKVLERVKEMYKDDEEKKDE